MVFKLVNAAAKTWRRLKGENQLPKVVQGLPIRLVANPMRRVIMDEDGSPRLSDVPSGVSAGFPG
jgi:hypothetical protein